MGSFYAFSKYDALLFTFINIKLKFPNSYFGLNGRDWNSNTFIEFYVDQDLDLNTDLDFHLGNGVEFHKDYIVKVEERSINHILDTLKNHNEIYFLDFLKRYIQSGPFRLTDEEKKFINQTRLDNRTNNNLLKLFCHVWFGIFQHENSHRNNKGQGKIENEEYLYRMSLISLFVQLSALIDEFKAINPKIIEELDSKIPIETYERFKRDRLVTVSKLTEAIFHFRDSLAHLDSRKDSIRTANTSHINVEGVLLGVQSGLLVLGEVGTIGEYIVCGGGKLHWTKHIKEFVSSLFVNLNLPFGLVIEIKSKDNKLHLSTLTNSKIYPLLTQDPKITKSKRQINEKTYCYNITYSGDFQIPANRNQPPNSVQSKR